MPREIETTLTMRRSREDRHSFWLYFRGKRTDELIPVDTLHEDTLSDVFGQELYEALRPVPPGKLLTLDVKLTLPED